MYYMQNLFFINISNFMCIKHYKNWYNLKITSFNAVIRNGFINYWDGEKFNCCNKKSSFLNKHFRNLLKINFFINQKVKQKVWQYIRK